MPEDQELKLFRDIREAYREAHRAWVDGDLWKAGVSLRYAQTISTDLLFELAKKERQGETK